MAEDVGALPLRVRLLVFAAIVLALVGVPFGALLWTTSVPGRSYAGQLPPLDAAQRALASRLRDHVDYDKLARVVSGLGRVIRCWATPAPLANPSTPR